MLTDFYLDESIFEAGLLKDESFCAVHDTIIDYWKRYGVLVMPDGAAASYLQSIKKLPPKFHQRWVGAFTSNSKYQSENSWGQCESYSTFQNACELFCFFETAVAEDTLSAVICDNDKTLRQCPSTLFEVVGIGSITESQNFKASRESSITDIRYGADINDVWMSKFEGFVRHQNKIYISDRYVFESVVRDLQCGYSKSSIVKFIEMLPLGRKFNITILSDGDAKGSVMHDEVCNYFTKYVVGSSPLAQKISRLKLVSMATLKFKRFAHDRYVRFDKHVCQVGVGMSIFERHGVPATSFTVKMLYESSAVEIERAAADSVWYEIFEV
ncbi:hypothetical protein PCAU_3681 [Pseudomonas chlororaphis subsp. aurantiaca]|uniref:hypothetical protein n=1 Tax=Pseudomonas chlororaphis TaxID=587753 RepID=UPI000864E78E|nr:hypothetical protein [Pseudomonas chlororaphis]BAV75890.1 hypothetical protein PCAU_3681 [Pseudomonas chlororaphis subsp. aurantiaca]